MRKLVKGLCFDHMQVQVAVKDVPSGTEHIFTIVGSESGAFYFSWDCGDERMAMHIDKPSAHMVAEALRRTANLPEIAKKKD